MTTKRTLEEMAKRLAGDAYRLATLDGAWATEKILAALREAADAARQEEREALKQELQDIARAYGGWSVEMEEVADRLDARELKP